MTAELPAEFQERIGVVTDEVDPDLDRAIPQLEKCGVRLVDIRGVGESRVPDLDEDGRRALLEIVPRFQVCALSPGLFKNGMHGAAADIELGRQLPETLDLAHQLGARQVIVFGGGPGTSRADCLAVLRDARDQALASDIELVVENSSLCRVATASDLRDLAETIGVRVVWDPANAVAAGATDPVNDSRALAPSTACVHVRDHDSRGWCRLDDGNIAWEALIGVLESQGFAERYVVESHLPDDTSATAWNLSRLAEYLGSRVS